MKVISLNANGIRAAQRKGFFDWLRKINPDVVCIQETKAQIDQLTLPDFLPKGYHCYYQDAEKKGYSGVAIYARREPDKVMRGLGYERFDSEGRWLQADFGDLSVCSLYLPSGSSKEERQLFKYEIMAWMMPLLKDMAQGKRQFIICGDWNIAHRKIDIKNWRSNQRNSGFLPEERAWMSELFGDTGMVDGFRVVDPREQQYTWWSNRGQAWANNTGWRIDYQVITPGLASRVQGAEIYKQERFSDHAPLILDYDWEFQ